MRIIDVKTDTDSQKRIKNGFVPSVQSSNTTQENGTENIEEKKKEEKETSKSRKAKRALS